MYLTTIAYVQNIVRGIILSNVYIDRRKQILLYGSLIMREGRVRVQRLIRVKIDQLCFDLAKE